ncbi:Mg2+ transporter protein CorA-like/Zinc transport protein ZntB [Penicillium malachiteum]|uniref:Mg2+ transporter protein CorA-like/Zinc transport protein ZntB n=1 Tax=Penicillium malachiteum TaxID=1324776 RepID=UPI002548D380|nr:Mg2+ transporter protein CorA-like/Zinc transport protein ZntB [Penicillium malachiteum]KAJ5731735.1 Mg2+ transporter protein CorA-like/Zinc transport protein ZntB [Penicillium malachiteum]
MRPILEQPLLFEKRVEIVKIILDHTPADRFKMAILAEDALGDTLNIRSIIYWALIHNNAELAKLAVRAGDNPKLDHKGDRQYATWLHVIAGLGNEHLLETDPSWRSDVLSKKTDQIMPLHVAAKMGHYGMTWKLIDTLERSPPSNDAPRSSGVDKVLQALIQVTNKGEDMISLASARKGESGLKLKESLVSKLMKVTEPNSDTDLVINFAARRYAAGEREYSRRLLNRLKRVPSRRGESKGEIEQNPLELAVYNKFPDTVSYLLASGLYLDPRHTKKCKDVMRFWDNDLCEEEQKKADLIKELLKSPPQVEKCLRRKMSTDESFSELSNSLSNPINGVVVDISASKDQVTYKVKQSTMVEIIYRKGPDNVFSHGQNEVTAGSASERYTGTLGYNLRGKPKELWWTSNLGMKASACSDARYRWIHILTNDELMFRIVEDKGQDGAAYRELVRKSWTKIASAGPDSHLETKPHFQIEEKAGSDTQLPRMTSIYVYAISGVEMVLEKNKQKEDSIYSAESMSHPSLDYRRLHDGVIAIQRNDQLPKDLDAATLDDPRHEKIIHTLSPYVDKTVGGSFIHQVPVVNQLRLWIIDGEPLENMQLNDLRLRKKQFLEIVAAQAIKSRQNNLADVSHLRFTFPPAKNARPKRLRKWGSKLFDIMRFLPRSMGSGIPVSWSILSLAVLERRNSRRIDFKSFVNALGLDGGEQWKALNKTESKKLRRWMKQICTEWNHSLSENPYQNISNETTLMHQVEKAVDELKILRDIFCDQKYVDDLWRGDGKGILWSRSITITERLETSETLIQQAKSLQTILQGLLDLKQKQASIIEAQFAHRQSDTVMVFTVVTIIFLPASFLGSLFALNVDKFPHEDGNLEFGLPREVDFPYNM